LQNSDGESIYVLHNITRIGKSAVAQCVAKLLDGPGTGALVSSFFFSSSSDNATRKTAKLLFPTLAHQFSCRSQEFAERISKQLRGNRDAVTGDFHTQFDYLIARPLKLPFNEETPIPFIIDALDECEDGNAPKILSLLLEQLPGIRRLKVLVTTRPERHIRTALPMAPCQHYKQFPLQSIEGSVVEREIRSYIDHSLCEEQVRRALPELTPWQPTGKQKDRLVTLSGKLFCIASTAVSLLLKPAGGLRRLDHLLGDVPPRAMGIMHNAYTQIINAAEPDSIDFQDIIGTLVLLYNPLPCKALAALIGVDENGIPVDEDRVVGLLCTLHSILAPSSDEHTFEVHHASFRDFVCSRNHRVKDTEDPDLHIDPKRHHLRTAKRCLRVMNDCLESTLRCLELDEWHLLQAEMRRCIRDQVPPHLAYACTYWACHLAEGLDSSADIDHELKQRLDHFACERLLVWLQMLSIIGCLDVAYQSLDTVRNLKQRDDSPKQIGITTYLGFWHGSLNANSSATDIALEVINDGCRLIQRNFGILHRSPMNIHRSVLPFIPRKSALFRIHGVQQSQPCTSWFYGYICRIQFVPKGSYYMYDFIRSWFGRFTGSSR